MFPLTRIKHQGNEDKIGNCTDFFFASCGALFPFTRANAQWVIHGFKVAL